MQLTIKQDRKTYKYSDTPDHGELYIYNFLNKEKTAQDPVKEIQSLLSNRFDMCYLDTEDKQRLSVPETANLMFFSGNGNVFEIETSDNINFEVCEAGYSV